MTARYFCGLDLGQVSDFSALAIVERQGVTDAAGKPTQDYRGQPVHEFDVVHIERFPLGTSYPAIVEKVKDLMGRRELRSGFLQAHVGPVLAIDSTGVGRGVTDVFLDAGMPCDVVPVTITAGTSEPRRDYWSVRGGPLAWWVPKLHLVSAVQAALSSKRLKIAPRLPLADLTRKELYAFQVRNTAAGNETFNARDGVHDDLVLAVALAVWLGSQPPPPCFALVGAIPVPLDPPRDAYGRGFQDPYEKWNRTDAESMARATSTDPRMLANASTRAIEFGGFRQRRKFYRDG